MTLEKKIQVQIGIVSAVILHGFIQLDLHTKHKTQTFSNEHGNSLCIQNSESKISLFVGNEKEPFFIFDNVCDAELEKKLNLAEKKLQKRLENLIKSCFKNATINPIFKGYKPKI